MDKIIINENNIKYDTVMVKARAIVLNEYNKVYVCNMNETYMLPGGTVESNELPLDTLKRELKEELGIVNCNLKELIEVDYYHYHFPKYNSVLYENRLNKVYYYLVQINTKDIGNNKFTDYEKEQNIKIEEYSFDELKDKLKVNNDNKYSKFTNKELQIILDYLDI